MVDFRIDASRNASKPKGQLSMIARYAWMPNLFHTTYYMDSANDLAKIVGDYDLIILDRDGAIQRYHGKEREPEFEQVLKLMAPKSEIVSNSSFKEFLNIVRIYDGYFPVSSLVRLDDNKDYLLTGMNNVLNAYIYDSADSVGDGIDNKKYIRPIDSKPSFIFHADSMKAQEFSSRIIHKYKKPDPCMFDAVIRRNISEGRTISRVLVFGDSYFNEVLGANIYAQTLAGKLITVHTARVQPYMPETNPLGLRIARELFDAPVGTAMSYVDRVLF